MVLFINPAYRAPGVNMVPGVSWEKHKKIHKAQSFHILYVAMFSGPLLYINTANHAPGVKNGPASGVISSDRLTMGKT